MKFFLLFNILFIVLLAYINGSSLRMGSSTMSKSSTTMSKSSAYNQVCTTDADCTTGTKNKCVAGRGALKYCRRG